MRWDEVPGREEKAARGEEEDNNSRCEQMSEETERLC